MAKNLPAHVGDIRNTGLILGSRRSPREGKDNPNPVFLPGKSHGHGSLAGYMESQRVVHTE